MKVTESVEGKAGSIFLHLTCLLHFRFDCRCVLWYYDQYPVVQPYVIGGATIFKEAFSLLKEVLELYNENHDMTYRYEHTLRVAVRGQQIADGAGWNGEPLIIACLLHDIGYPECKTRMTLVITKRSVLSMIIGVNGNWIYGEHNAARIINGCMEQLKQMQTTEYMEQAMG